jgi:hypothetical protein
VADVEGLVRVGLRKLDHQALAGGLAGAEALALFQYGVYYPAQVFAGAEVEV